MQDQTKPPYVPVDENIPVQLRGDLERAWKKSYADFYLDKGGFSVEETLNEIVAHIISLFKQDALKINVLIGYSIALAAKRTLDYYLPQDERAEKVLEQTRNWIDGLPFSDLHSTNPFSGNMSAVQAIDEASAVFENLIRATIPKLNQDAVLEILYESVTGDAISAVPQDKRRIFDWIISDVIPSAVNRNVADSYFKKAWPYLPLT